MSLQLNLNLDISKIAADFIKFDLGDKPEQDSKGNDAANASVSS